MKTVSALATAALLVTAAAGIANAAPIVFTAIGTSPSDLAGTVDSFRTSLGALNPNTAGSFGSGRREINWDGVPDAFSAPNAFPGDFFNGAAAGRARGAVFTTPGLGFQVSADTSNPTSTPILFDNLLTAFGSDAGSANFRVFSAERLFTAIGSNITDVLFFVPGTNTDALTRGFGVVFTDTDDGTDSNTGLEFFDAGGTSLGAFLAPSDGTNQNLSFLGVDFGTSIVSRVRITSGRCTLPPPGGACVEDVVVMDDFIYGEPVAAVAGEVPAPPALILFAGAVATLAGFYRRRA